MENSTQQHIASRHAAILYGSETGNAQDAAEELGALAERLHFTSVILPLDEIEPLQLQAFDLILVAVATTGQGEMPANARRFWKAALRKKLSASSLERCHFAVFGLGDSSYPRYNWAGLKLRKRLLQLGAQEFHAFGKGDEQHAERYEGVFSDWIKSLKTSLQNQFPLPDGVVPIADDVFLPPKWSLELCSTATSNTNNDATISHSAQSGSASAPSISADTSLEVQLTQNKRLTPADHWQDVRHLVFESSQHVDYLPGDVLVIQPHNPDQDVQSVIDLMQWHDVADAPIAWKRTEPAVSTSSDLSASEKACNAVESSTEISLNAVCSPSNTVFPSLDRPPFKVSTLRDLLTTSLDLNAVPRRSFFAQLSHFTHDEMQQARLIDFSKADHLDELYDYTTRPRRSILEVLQDFHTVRIPWQWAAHVLPALRGRQFSIASGGHLKYARSEQPRASLRSAIDEEHGRSEQLTSNNEHAPIEEHLTTADTAGTRFELLVALVKYRTVIRKMRRGTCSRYLETLPEGARLNVHLQRGGLHLDSRDFQRPLVLVGPGTGVAPLRSLLWERVERVQSTQPNSDGPATLSPALLFFGNRNRQADFFFEGEWTNLEQCGAVRLFTAFSRDVEGKIYVQDRIRQQARAVFELLVQQSGMVYICGSSGKMPRAVRAALVEALHLGGDMSTAAAEAHIVAMEKNGDYKQETW